MRLLPLLLLLALPASPYPISEGGSGAVEEEQMSYGSPEEIEVRVCGLCVHVQTLSAYLLPTPALRGGWQPLSLSLRLRLSPSLPLPLYLSVSLSLSHPLSVSLTHHTRTHTSTHISAPSTAR